MNVDRQDAHGVDGAHGLGLAFDHAVKTIRLGILCLEPEKEGNQASHHQQKANPRQAFHRQPERQPHGSSRI
jgi:hypothetical protein